MKIKKLIVALVLIVAIGGGAATAANGMTLYGYYDWGGFIANAGVDAWAYSGSPYDYAFAYAATGSRSSGWLVGEYVSASVWVWPWNHVYRYHFFW